MVLEAIGRNDRTTQRSLASHLGIALGLTNLYLKRLVRKGYIKCVSIPSNRVRYLITPKGIAEKTRLTYEFMDYSLQVYRQGRNHLRTILSPYAAHGEARIAIYGTGEAAELSYLCLRELMLDPVLVLDDVGGGKFFGLPVAAVDGHASDAYDHVIVASMDCTDAKIRRLLDCGVPASKLLPLRPPSPVPAANE